MTIWATEIKELEKLYDSFKGQLSDLEKELERLIKTDDENIVLIYSRRCLEVIITDLCEFELKRPRKTEPLKGIIDKLNQEEKVPSYIIASMHSLNSLSTFGAHPKEFDPRQVKPVLNNLATIIEWYRKYKAEKVEPDKKEKVVDRPDERQADTMGRPDSIDEETAKTNGRSTDFDGSQGGTKEHSRSQKTFKKPFIIVSGILLFAIILYIVLDQFNFFRKDKFKDIRDPEGKISIAVMPFENQTGDTTLNWFQRGISSLIINGLGNSSELAVLDDQTMFEVMESMNQVYTAGISPSVAREVAKKVKAETYLSGSFQGREDTYWILVNLVNTENGNIIWTNKVEGNLKSSGYLDMADSLCNEIKNYLEIKALEDIADYDFREAYPKSAEAYRYFIEGMNLVLNQNYESGIQSLKKALEIDSTFTFASFYLAYAYNIIFSPEQNIWLEKAYRNKDRIPTKYQLWVNMWYATLFGKSVKDVSRYCDMLAESGINTRLFWSDLGVTYCDFTHEYEKAIPAFEKVMEINKERGADWKLHLFYDRYLMALHKIGNHEREKEIADIGLNVIPAVNSNWILYRIAVCALSQGKMDEADEILVRYYAKHKEKGTSEYILENYLGGMYMEAKILDQAEIHFRKAYELNPQDIFMILFLADFLIGNDINMDEGMELIEKASAINPDEPYLLMFKGRGLYRQGKYEDAVQLLRRAKEEFPGPNYDLYNYLAEAEQALAKQNKLK
jgi:TolB-like protein